MSSTSCNVNPQSQVSLKLFIDKTRHKILFGEADKNLIDFLFGILAFPVGKIFELVSTENMSTPLRNLYHSVQNLNANYFQDAPCQNALLRPRLCFPQSRISIFPIESSLPKGYYACSYSSCRSNYVSTNSTAQCPGCKNAMSKKLQLIVSGSESDDGGKKGYVKEMVCYMLMDDLTVKPMSLMSSVAKLAELGVENVGNIEQKVVYLDIEQGLNLLRATLCSSSTVLSDVFLSHIKFEDHDSISSISDEKVASFIKE